MKLSEFKSSQQLKTHNELSDTSKLSFEKDKRSY